MQHYVIKCVSDLRQVGGFLRILRSPPPIKLICVRYDFRLFCLLVCVLCLTVLSTIAQLYRGRSVLLVEETVEFGENHRPVASH
jgi:hypothetical protein